ncbi:MAG: aldolase/citrate lyase family protein [Pseudomonadota bacterium]
MVINNTLRERLEADQPTLGTHFMFVDPDIPELIGDTGFFDYAEFTAEYATFDMQLLYHMARAGQCGNLPLMIKLDQEAQGFWAQAALGAGFSAVLFTDIRNPGDVDECYRCMRPDFPGQGGAMGVKLRRPALGAYDVEAYAVELQRNVIAIMIEKDLAVDHLDEILERARDKRVDMTQWGPADFGFSRGEPRMSSTPAIRQYEELVIAKSLEYGIHPRIEIGAVEQAQRYLDLGVKHFCIGWDRFMYRTSVARLGEQMRKLIE